MNKRRKKIADRLLASLPGPDPIGIRIERGREASSQATNRPESRAEQVPVAASSAPLDLDALEQQVKGTRPWLNREPVLALIQRVREAEVALQRYGEHDDDCRTVNMNVLESSCNCGLVKALRKAPVDPNSTLIGGSAAANWKAVK